MYTKLQIEHFPALTGGYTSWGGVFGGNINKRFRNNSNLVAYGGIRLIAQVFRNDGFVPIYGFEAGLDYELPNNFFIGIKGTYDHRKDMWLLRYPVIWRYSTFVKVGYKFRLRE